MHKKTFLNIMLEYPWTMLSYMQWTNCPLKSSMKRFWLTTDSAIWDCNTFCLLVCLPRLLFECRSRGAMKSPQDENFSGLLRLFNGVGNASCFHKAHNPPILQFRPPLFTRLLVYVWSKSVKCFLNVRHFFSRLHLSSFTPCRAAWDQR